MTQTALDMPDGLRPPFYTVVYRYGVKIKEEWDELSHALMYLAHGEDYGEFTTDECGDADGWLWRRDPESATRFEVAERAPHRPHFPFGSVSDT